MFVLFCRKFYLFSCGSVIVPTNQIKWRVTMEKIKIFLLRTSIGGERLVDHQGTE